MVCASEANDGNFFIYGSFIGLDQVGIYLEEFACRLVFNINPEEREVSSLPSRSDSLLLRSFLCVR